MSTPSPALHDITVVVIGPGDYYFGHGRTRISTLLGSCVSITLWHPRKRIGGMCHYMLSERARPPDSPPDARFASEAFELLLYHIDIAGTRPSEYQAKLFGGSNMFTDEAGRRMAIGPRNIEFGQRFLTANSIALIAQHIGGSGRRKLHFDLWSGDVWLAFPEGEGAKIRSYCG
mgnify:CR=1 FL=1